PHVLELAHRVDHPRVVHADVDRAQVPLDARDGVLHLRRVPDVARVATGGRTARGDLTRRLFSPLGVEIHDGDFTTLPRQHHSVGFAEAAGAAGHEGALAGDPEIHRRRSAPLEIAL